MSDKETAISIEELCVMKMTQSNDKNSVVSTSKPRKVIIFSAEECSDIAGIDELVTAEEGTKAPVQTDKPKIQKVPMVLRGHINFEKLYEPRAVPIGPIHHKDEKLKLAQQYKPRLAAQFVKESGKTTTELYEKIKEEMEALKLFFDPEVIKDYKEEELSWMLFLDGCSTLQFMYGVVHEKMREYNIKSDQVAFAQQDLFLLENQIPFKVLTLLLGSSNAKAELKESIKRFLQMNVMAPSHMWASIEIDIDKEDPTHLLELLQKVAVSRSTKDDESSKQKCSPKDDESSKQKYSPKDDESSKQKCSPKDGKLSEKFTNFLPKGLKKKKHIGQQSFRNVQELKAAGIKLKPSENWSLREIDFTSRCFILCLKLLKLPPLVVDDSTEPKLLNMIAYEMCPDNFRTDYEVSSYVIFLDSLIDHSNDVKELRSAKILYNLLGSDEEVAGLFNEIATDLVTCPSFYRTVIEKIQRHYDNRVMTWMAEAYNTHFSSPWTILAFLGALIALALTFVQTWLAFNPPS
ncbi:hypothetical protein UlMin_006191 [Ulmus minor]